MIIGIILLIDGIFLGTTISGRATSKNTKLKIKEFLKWAKEQDSKREKRNRLRL